MRRREFVSAAAARAQPSSKVHRLGYLSVTRIPNVTEALQTGLRELGYVEGKNLKVEYRFGGQQSQRLHAIASEPVELRPDAIVTAGTSAVFAAKRHRVPAIHEMREFVKDHMIRKLPR